MSPSKKAQRFLRDLNIPIRKFKVGGMVYLVKEYHFKSRKKYQKGSAIYKEGFPEGKVYSCKKLCDEKMWTVTVQTYKEFQSQQFPTIKDSAVLPLGFAFTEDKVAYHGVYQALPYFEVIVA